MSGDVVLITGASGSGTTTLGGALARHLDRTHLDTDDFYWVKTEPAVSGETADAGLSGCSTPQH